MKHIERDDQEPEPIDWDEREQREAEECNRRYEMAVERQMYMKEIKHDS